MIQVYKEEYYYKSKIIELYDFYKSISEDIELLEHHKLITDNYNYINELLSQVVCKIKGLDNDFTENITASNVDKIIDIYTLDIDNFRDREIEFYSKLISKSLFCYSNCYDEPGLISYLYNMHLLDEINTKIMTCLDEAIKYKSLF